MNLETPIAVTTHSGYTLNEEQAYALEAMLAWIKTPDEPFFVLSGFAGTGKTFTCKALTEQAKGRVAFTAPTNKAVKVLRETLTTDTYRPDCATIYSLLGLRMEANGEVKELKGREIGDEDGLDLGVLKLVVVDEGSMVNEILRKHIMKAAADYRGLKFLFMGDPAQLPPVGELTSPIWKMECRRASLTKVMRHDNQILELVTRIRKVVDHPAPAVKLVTDFNYEKGEGVYVSPPDIFTRMVTETAQLGDFSLGSHAKVVAWRNVTVDKWNALIRRTIFSAELAAANTWLLDDRVVFTGPASDLDDKPMARTDDEGVITTVDVQAHPVYADWKVYRLGIILDTNRTVTAFVLHPTERARFEAHCNELASYARIDKQRWQEYWAIREAFHGVRHAYAFTAHRAQGSTYRVVFVDYRDILINRNRQEAYRCLYVACSRPTTQLILG